MVDSVIEHKLQVYIKSIDASRLDYQYHDGIKSSELMQQVFRMVYFVYGTLTENEKYLFALLEELYTPLSASVSAQVNFMEIHRIKSLRDVLYRFPGKLYN